MQNFNNWCRLCARKDQCTKDVLEQDEKHPNICSIIDKHFSLQIKLNSRAPSTICIECYGFLLKLIEFERKVQKSQTEFEEKPNPGIDSIVLQENEDIGKEVEITQEQTTKAIFPCPQCQETFELESEFRNHVKTHFKLSCVTCGTLFGKIIALRAHLKVVHSDDRPNICDQCGMSFKRAGDLRRHMDFHRDDTPYTCGICDKKFKNKMLMKMHEKGHGAAKHMCQICELELKSKAILRAHLLTHTNSFVHECRFCFKRFRYKKNLDIHMSSHSGIQPYSCIFCNKQFSLRWNCTAHLKKIHPKEFSENEKEGKESIIAIKQLVKQRFTCVPAITTSGSIKEENITE